VCLNPALEKKNLTIRTPSIMPFVGLFFTIFVVIVPTFSCLLSFPLPSGLLPAVQNDASGEKMKDLAIEMNITLSAVDYLIQHVPEKL